MFFFRKKICKQGHAMDPSWKKCPVCMAPVRAWLIPLEDNGKPGTKVYTIHEGKNKIGQGADCEIRILLNDISRHHAMLSCYPGSHSITDLSSSNGTFINNRQILNQSIIDGDIIKLGTIELKFKCL